MAAISGLVIEGRIVIRVEGLPGNEYEVDGATDMNCLELACISGSIKLVQYLLDE